MLVEKTESAESTGSGGRQAESASKEAMLDVADRLFGAKGIAAVTLRDIARELGLTHASLYYHFPGGKEQLYVEVTRRSILKHGAAIAGMIAGRKGDLRGQLEGISTWVLSQPPVDLVRMALSDMPVLDQKEARMLMELMHSEMLQRVQGVLQSADERGEINCANPALVGSALLGMLESFHSIPEFAVRGSRVEMAGEMLDILLRGLGYRDALD